MNRISRAAALTGLAGLAALSAARPAAALVTQPNGQIMPVDSMNGEIQLYSLFQSRGEPIDYQADGGTTPATFSPLCDFTAELLLKESASSLSVGWYNVDPNASQPPAQADIHIIVPAGSPVGTVITAEDIKNDAAYAGGLIGFALVGPGYQIHYSEPQWNPLCSGCNPPGNWITAVIYASVMTPNAYYLAFEDGSVGANPNQFNNDGDYNDYVYIFSGLTCAGGGEPCDTGLPGVCGPGVTQCTSAGVVCQGLVPSSGELCDGVDNNCDGVADEGDLCEPGFVCDKGTCVAACSDDEFVCPPNKTCDDSGYCVDPSCAGVDCPEGEVCVSGTCKAPCDGISCPYPTVCRVGACVDPCASITCESGQVCDGGVCKANCACAPCPAGLACEGQSGLCMDPLCLGVSCQPGTHCVGGSCVDSCEGAVCPGGQICEAGACVVDPSAGTGGSGSTSGVGVGVGGGTGTGVGGSGGAGSGGAPGGGNGSGSSGETGGCGCRAAGGEPTRAAGLGALAAIMALLGLRRRQGRQGERGERA
uniref:Follistatin-like domain-containing protein n=1 Tax=Jahnella sp. MSr9139 TaxID=1434086 RepID=A0A3S7UW26_9BACT|nr:hypothetical protein [Jahnella sp. MSr9139]